MPLPRSATSSPSALWEDLEAFHVIAEGLRTGKTLQHVAGDPHSLIGSARMLYLRLGRLERTLGRRLVDRRPWGRDARLTEAGARLAAQVADLVRLRRQIEVSSAEPDVPVLRIATHSTLISTLLPAVVEESRQRRQNTKGFSLDLELVRTYADALSAVAEGRVDAGLYLALPGIDGAPLPRNVRDELLGCTELLVLFHPSHWFGARREKRRGAIRLEELADECVITRGYLDAKLPAAGPRGSRITVPHTLDALAFVRLEIGVSLIPRLAYELSTWPRDLRALPLSPAIVSSLVLLRPRKLLRPLTAHAEEFLEDLRAYGRARSRVNS